MFSEVLDSLANGVTNIDSVISQRKINSKNFDQSRGASWRLDEELKATINNIKVYSENLSKTCLKLVLIASKNPSQVILKSIVDELLNTSNGFLVAYYTFLNQSVSDCLFEYVSKSVRVLACHVKQLASDVADNNFEAANMHTGMIIKISEDAQRLPLANRLAYRRYIMEKCAILKDTVKEFGEYVTSYRTKQINNEENEGDVPRSVFTGMQNLSMNAAANKSAETEDEEEQEEDEDDNDDDDDDMDFDDEDIPYTEEEINIVEKCVSLMTTSYTYVKAVLTAVSVVSDGITEEIKTKETSGGVSPELIALEVSSMQWVASLTKLSNTIQDQVTDLGAELYPPFMENMDSTVKPLATILLVSLGMTLDLLQDEQFRPYQSAELSESISSIAVSLPFTVNL